MRQDQSTPLLSLRAAVILVIAATVGVLAGVLSFLAERSLPQAVLLGGGAAGASTALFHSIIARG